MYVDCEHLLQIEIYTGTKGYVSLEKKSYQIRIVKFFLAVIIVETHMLLIKKKKNFLNLLNQIQIKICTKRTSKYTVNIFTAPPT